MTVEPQREESGVFTIIVRERTDAGDWGQTRRRRYRVTSSAYRCGHTPTRRASALVAAERATDQVADDPLMIPPAR